MSASASQGPARRSRAFALVALLLACLTAHAAPARAAQGDGAFAPGRALEERRDETVLSIEVQGASRYSRERLVATLGQEIGAPLDRKRVAEGLESLWRVFHVRAQLQEYAVDGGLRLRLLVEELPVDLEPRFIGNEEIKTDELEEWSQLGDRKELFLHEAPLVRERLLAGYRREGFHFAEVREVVRPAQVGEDGVEVPGDVIFEIREGPRVHVSKVVVHGNESLPDRGVLFWKSGLKYLAKLELKGPSLFDWSGAEFVQQELESDLIALRQVYRDRGYLDAVVEIGRLEFSRDRSRVRIHIEVDEGERYRVGEVRIEAFETYLDGSGPDARVVRREAELFYPESQLLAECALSTGRAFEQSLIDGDNRALRSYYGSRGYIDHPSLSPQVQWRFLDPDLRFDPEHHVVDVTYRVVQGQRIRIREVRFAGALHTRDRVLRREVTVMPGDQADMEEILASLRRLRSTGYFTDEQDLDHRQATFRFVPTGDPQVVDLEFQVEEGRVVNFQIGGGVDSNDGLVGFVLLTMRNFDITDLPSGFWSSFGEVYRKEAFHGAGQTLEIEVSPGSERDRTRLRFFEPDVFRTHFRRWGLDLQYLSVDRIWQDYEEDFASRRVRLQHVFEDQDWVMWIGYDNKDIDVSDLDTSKPLPQQLLDQEGSLDLVAGLLDVRFRDLDSAFNPREGRNVLLQNEVYTDFLNSDREFFKTVLTYDRYWLIGPATEDVRPGFKLSLGAGYADSFDGGDVPYTERFFLGGINTLRGFAYRGVGPNVSDVPIGGETMARASLDYRFPLYSVTQPGTYRKREMLRGELFVDMGVLDPASGELDPDELRVSAGFGFGLSYPLPVIFYFGFPIEDGSGDDRQVFSFRIASFAF